VTAIARARQAERDPFALHWAGLACVLAYLSLDETAMLHEATMPLLQRTFHPTGVFAYEWIVIALPVVVLFLIAYFRFVMSLPWSSRLPFIVAGTLYLSGGLGLEMVEGVIETQGSEAGLLMTLARAFEEILEMAGVFLFTRALFDIVESLPHAAGVPDVRVRTRSGYIAG
jgi:hypothetical protein